MDLENPFLKDAAKNFAERRRVLYKLLTAVLAIGILLGFVAGLLIADRWYEGREVISIRADNGTEV